MDESSPIPTDDALLARRQRARTAANYDPRDALIAYPEIRAAMRAYYDALSATPIIDPAWLAPCDWPAEVARRWPACRASWVEIQDAARLALFPNALPPEPRPVRQPLGSAWRGLVNSVDAGLQPEIVRR